MQVGDWMQISIHPYPIPLALVLKGVQRSLKIESVTDTMAYIDFRTPSS